jgi:autotransporter translocation and assembly factor TamB
MLAGTTDNAALNISGDFDQGSYKITTAALQADSGSATVSGKLSLADQTLALNLQLMPDVSPPLALQKSLTGSWADPRPALVIAPALHWTPAPQRR